MSTSAFQVVVIKDQSIVVQVVNVQANASMQRQPLSIQAQKGYRYQLKDMTSSKQGPPAQVQLKRVGKDLHLVFQENADPTDVILEGYYDVTVGPSSGLVGEFDGFFYEYTSFSADVSPLTLADGAGHLYWVLGGAGVVSMAAPLVGALGIHPAWVAVVAVRGANAGGDSGNAAAAALSAISAAAQAKSATEGLPDVATYAAAGVSGVNAGNLAAINSALNSALLNGIPIATASQIQMLVNAYAAILAGADGNYTNNNAIASTAQYSAIGITGMTDAIRTLVNDRIDGLSASAVDSVGEVQTLVNAAVAVMSGAAGGAAPSLAQLQVLGINGVTADNLAAVQAAIAVTAADGSGVDTQDELQAVVTSAAATVAAAIATISAAAQANNASANTPDAATYAAAGVSGVNAVNLAAINSALNSVAVNAAATTTAAQIQTLVNAFNDVLVAADGNYTNNGAAALSQGDYTVLGVTGTNPASAALLSSVIDGKVSTDVNTVQKLQTMADAAKAVLGYDDPVAGAGAAPSAAQINTLIAGQRLGGTHVPTVTEDDLAAVRVAISAANSDGTPLATRAEIAVVVKAAVDAYAAAIDVIEAYAVDSSAPAPTDAQYAAAGVTGVTSANVAAINSAIHAQAGTNGVAGATGASDVDDATAVDSAAKLQAIVNAYRVILDNAQAVDTTAAAAITNATQAQYATLGVRGVDTPQALSLLGSVIDSKAVADVSNVSQLQALADASQVVLGYDNASTDTAPTVSELNRLVTGVTEANLITVLRGVEAVNNTGALVTQGILQTLVDSITQSLAQITQAAKDNTAVSGALTPATFQAAGIQSVSSSNLGLINQWLDTDAIGGAASNTPEKIQNLVNAVAKIRALADGTADTGAKLVNADISALGLSSVIGVDTKLNLFNDILDKATSQSADSAAKLLAMADRVDRIIQTAKGQTLSLPLTAQDFSAVGLVGVENAKLSLLLAAMVTAVMGTDARPVDSLAELQTLIQTVNWLSSTAPASMAEATNGVSAIELANGLQTVVTLPAGASVGDVLTLLFKAPSGDQRTVTHNLTAQNLAAGQVTMLAPPSVVDSTENGLYTLTSTIARALDGLSTADSVSTFVLDTVAPTLVVTAVAGDNVWLEYEVADGVSTVVVPAKTSGEFSAAERFGNVSTPTSATPVAVPVMLEGTTNAEVGQSLQIKLNEKTYLAEVEAVSVMGQSNRWKVTLPEVDAKALNHGNYYDVTVQVSDVSGNSMLDNNYKLFVNIAFPDIPTVDNVLTHGTRISDTNPYTAKPTLTGKALKLDVNIANSYVALEAGDTITVVINNHTITGSIGSLPAGLSYDATEKTWRLDTGLVSGFTALADGIYNVSVKVFAGDEEKFDLSSNELHIQSTPPTLVLDPIAADGRINASESSQALVITGTTNAQVGAVVTLELGVPTYTTVVQSGQSGNTFTLTVPANAVQQLTDGPQAMQVKVTNTFGAETLLNSSLTVDTQAPGQNAEGTEVLVVVLTEAVNATPGINTAELTDGLQAQVTLPTGSALGDTLEIAVTAPNGTLRVFSHPVTGTEASNGSASITLPVSTVAENGTYSITVTTTDLAGNSSRASVPVSFTFDTRAPGNRVDGTPDAIPAPVLTLAEADNGVNQTELANGLQYHIALPSGSQSGDALVFTFKGPDNTQRTFSHTVTSAEAAAAAANLTLPNTLVNQDGTYIVTVTSSDAAGNVGLNAANTGTTTFVLNAALSTLRDTAQTNIASHTTPDLSVYAKAGIVGVNAGNLAAINSSLNAQAIDGAATNTLAKVQAMVDAYIAILAEANGSSPDADPSDPTPAKYAAIGVTGVDSDAKAQLLGAVIGAKSSSDVDRVPQIQSLADAVASTVAYTGGVGQTAPTALQLNSLTGSADAASSVTADNLSAVLMALAAANADGTVVASETELKGLIEAAVSGFDEALTTLTGFAQDQAAGLAAVAAGDAVPALAVYAAAGVHGVDASNVHAINDALASLRIDGTQVDTAAKVQDLVDAYLAVLGEANGMDPDANAASNPTPDHYYLIGANIGAAASDSENLALLNDLVAAQTATGVDTVAKINELARIANAIQTTAANGTASLSHTDLALIGLNHVTADNLAAVLNAVAAQPDSGSSTSTLSQLQALVDGAVASFQSALSVIQAAANNNNNNATATSPSLAQYAALGLSNVTAQNLAAINSALNDPDITATQVNTAAQVNSLVTAFNTILATADGVANNSANPTASDYALLGVNGVSAGLVETLLGEVIDGKTLANVNTVNKVQDLADAVLAVMAGTASQVQLESLGVSWVTETNLSTLQAALLAASDATELNTLAGLQTVVFEAIHALAAIKTAAQNNNANATTLSLALYDAIGVTGMGGAGQPTLAMINSALNSDSITSDQADTAGKVQAIVDAYQVILNNANAADAAAAGAVVNATQAQYAAIGVTGVDTAQEVSLMGSVIDGKALADVETVEKLQSLATAVQAVMNGNATEAQLESLGVDPTLVSASNLSTVRAALAAANYLTELNTLAGLQSVVQAAVTAAGKVAAYAQDDGLAAASNAALTPTAADYDAMGVSGLGANGQPSVASINSALSSAAITGTQADTAGKVQAIVNAYQVILNNANAADAAAAGAVVNATQAQYAAIGVTGVDTAQEVSLMGSVIDGKALADVETVEKLQSLATAVQAVMNGNATEAQLESLGVDPTLVSASNLSTVQAALAAANYLTELNTLTGLQSVVQAAVTAAGKVAAYAQDDSLAAASDASLTPTEADYDAMGVTGVNAQNLASINDALADLDVTGEKADTAAKVQAIVDGFNAILSNATGSANSVPHPTAVDYAAIGVAGVDTPQEVSLLGEVIDRKGRTDVATVSQVQDLANAGQAVMDGQPTAAQLALLGIVNVTSANLGTVQAAMAMAAANETTQLSTLLGLQNVVDNAINAEAAIRDAAQDNNASVTTPSLAQYLAAGVTGVNANNLAAINSALNDLDITGEQANTASKVQAIVDAYNAILNNANYAATANPTQAHYAAIGVSGVNNAEKAQLLGDRIDTLAVADVDQVAEVQSLADAVSAVMAAAALTSGATSALTQDQLEKLSIFGVTEDNLQAVRAAIVATADDGTAVDSLAKLQALVTAAVNDAASALSTLGAFAQNNAAGLANASAGTAPAVTVYAQAGVSGVTAGNVNAINDALASLAVDGAAVNSAAKVQAIVDAYNAVLSSANDVDASAGNNTAATTPAVSAAQLALIGAQIGLAATDAENLALLGDIIAGAQSSDVRTVAAISEMARIANAIQLTAANGAPNPALTAADLLKVGLTDVTTDNLPAVLAAIAAANNDGIGTDSLSDVQTLVTSASQAAANALLLMSAYAQNNANGFAVATGTAPLMADFAAAGVVGVTASNLNAIRDALASSSVNAAAANTTAKVQAIVDAFNTVLAQANDTANTVGNNTPATATNATAAQYALIGADIGLASTDAHNLSLLNDIVAGLQTGAVNTVAKVNNLARIANAIQLTAADGTPAPALGVADFALLGLSGVTADNLPAVLLAIAEKNPNGSETASLADLQTLITATATTQSAAMGLIATYAETGLSAPSEANYAAAGVTGVNSANLSAINDAVNKQKGSDAILGNANDRDGADTTAEVQAIVNAFNAILAEANGASADATQGDPSAAKYALTGADIGAAAVVSQNLALLNDIVGGQASTGVNTVAKITELARIANAIQSVAATGASTPALTQADFTAIGLLGVTTDNLPSVLAAIAAKDDTGIQTASLSQVQAVITAAVQAHTQALDKIKAYAVSSSNSVPTEADFVAAGVSGVDAANLSAIQDAVSQQTGTDATLGNADDNTSVDTTAKVQAIVNAYNAILGEANDTTSAAGDNVPDATPSVDPTAAQYALIGANIGSAATAPNTLALLNDIVGGLQASDVNTVAKINQIASIANAIQSVTSTGTSSPALTPELLVQAGISGVTTDNLPAALAAIANQNDNGSETDRLAKVQAVVTAAVQTVNAALDLISAFAQDNSTGLLSATGTAPGLNAFHAAAITGVDAQNLASIQDALASAAVGADQANSRVKVQAIVDAFNAVLSEANGATADAGTDPTADQYAVIGVTGVSAGVKADLLIDVIGIKVRTDVDTVGELQTLANAVSAVMANATGVSGVSLAQLQALDVTGVTAANLAAIQTAIAATPDSGTGVDEQLELQTLVNNVNAAVLAISTFAQDNSTGLANATGTAPTRTVFTTAGVTGVSDVNIAAINDALASASVSGLSVDEPAEIQALVSAFNAILASADGVDNDAPAPTAEQYAAIGVTGVAGAAELSLLGDVLDLKTTNAVNTVAQVQTLADAVKAVMNTVARLTPVVTSSQLALLGVTGVTTGNISRVLAALASTLDDGSTVSTLAGLFSVANVPQATATITSVTDNFGPVSAAIAHNGFSDDATPTLSGAYTGTLLPGQVVAVYDTLSGARFGAVTVDTTNQTWTFTPASPISTIKVDFSFQAVVENAYRLRDDTPSATHTLKFDNTALLVNSMLSGAVASAGDLKLVFNQSVSPVSGKKIRLFDNTNTEVATIDANNAGLSASVVTINLANVTVNPNADLVMGKSYYVLVDAGAFRTLSGMDFAGISTPNTWTFYPADPVTTVDFGGVTVSNGINATELASLTVGGTVSVTNNAWGSVTSLSIAAIRFVSSSGHTVNVSGAMPVIDSTTRAWTLINNSAWISQFNSGESYRAEVDLSSTLNGAPANSTSQTSPVLIDTTPPTIAIDATLAGENVVNAAEDHEFGVSGTSNAEDGQTVTVTFTDSSTPTPQSITRSATVLNGAWALSDAQRGDISAFANGNVTVSATVSDRVGNSASATPRTVVLDNALPTVSGAPAITSSSGLVNGSLTTLNEGDTVTFTVTFSEAITVNTSVGSPKLALNIGGTTVQANYAGGTGTTALTFTAAITAGLNDANGISVAANALVLNGSTLKDAAGNPAVIAHITMSDNAAFVVDTAAPTAPLMALGTGVMGGASSAEATSAGGVVMVTAEQGANVVVTFTNGANSVQVNVTGNGSTPVAVSLTSANLVTLGNGPVQVSAVATDAGGNASPAGTTLFTLDSSPPDAPVLAWGAGVSGGATASEATASSGVVSVTAEQGATVVLTLTDSATPANTFTKTFLGNGSIAVAVVLSNAERALLAEGLVTVSAIATDTAGNGSSAGTTTFTLDTTPPAAPASAPASYGDDVGTTTSTASTASTTDDNTPVSRWAPT